MALQNHIDTLRMRFEFITVENLRYYFKGQFDGVEMLNRQRSEGDTFYSAMEPLVAALQSHAPYGLSYQALFACLNLIQKWTADQKEVAGRIDGLYQDLAEKEPGLPPFIDPEYPPLMKAFRESCASLKKHLSERLAADKLQKDLEPWGNLEYIKTNLDKHRFGGGRGYDREAEENQWMNNAPPAYHHMWDNVAVFVSDVLEVRTAILALFEEIRSVIKTSQIIANQTSTFYEGIRKKATAEALMIKVDLILKSYDQISDETTFKTTQRVALETWDAYGGTLKTEPHTKYVVKSAYSTGGIRRSMTYTKEPRFKREGRPFKNYTDPPLIIYGLNRFEFSKNNDINIRSSIGIPSKTHAELRIDTTDTTGLTSSGMYWLELPPNDTRYKAGVFDFTTQLEPSSQGEGQLEKLIKFDEPYTRGAKKPWVQCWLTGFSIGNENVLRKDFPLWSLEVSAKEFDNGCERGIQLFIKSCGAHVIHNVQVGWIAVASTYPPGFRMGTISDDQPLIKNSKADRQSSQEFFGGELDSVAGNAVVFMAISKFKGSMEKDLKFHAENDCSWTENFRYNYGSDSQGVPGDGDFVALSMVYIGVGDSLGL